MAWVVRRPQMSCGQDAGLRAPTARAPEPRSCNAAITHLAIAELALAARSLLPALTTAPPPPSRLETRRASCASSCPHSLASRSSAARPYCALESKAQCAMIRRLIRGSLGHSVVEHRTSGDSLAADRRDQGSPTYPTCRVSVAPLPFPSLRKWESRCQKLLWIQKYWD